MFSHSSSRAAVAAVLLLIAPTLAQIDAIKCPLASYNWATNSLNQDACLMSAYALSACNDGVANVTGLADPAGGSMYTGPSGPDNDDICKCNSPAYSIISACAGCQGGGWISYSTFVANCTKVTPFGQWPAEVVIPADTAFPAWAFINLTTGTWSNITAFNYKATNNTEVTRSNSNTTPSSSAGRAPVPTGSSGPNNNNNGNGVSGSPNSGSSSPSKSNVGAIVGGVVGGIVGLALIGGAIAFFVIRSRRQRAPSAMFLAPSQGGTPDNSTTYSPSARMPEPSFYPSAMPPTLGPQRLYDPSDPTTFPGAGSPSGGVMPSGSPGPTIDTASQHGRPWGDVQNQQYRGLPEL